LFRHLTFQKPDGYCTRIQNTDVVVSSNVFGRRLSSLSLFWFYNSVDRITQNGCENGETTNPTFIKLQTHMQILFTYKSIFIYIYIYTAHILYEHSGDPHFTCYTLTPLSVYPQCVRNNKIPFRFIGSFPFATNYDQNFFIPRISKNTVIRYSVIKFNDKQIVSNS